MRLRQFLAQASLMRISAAMRIIDQLWMLHRFLLNSLRGYYLGYVSIAVLSRGFSIIALAGSIKIALVTLLNWKNAIQFGEKAGLSLEWMTKTDVAAASALVVMALYAVYAFTLRLREKLRIEFVGRADVETFRILLSDRVYPRFSAPDNSCLQIQNDVKLYQVSAMNLANAISFASLSLVIIFVLSVYLPELVAFFAILLLPIIVFYLLSGRRMAAVRQEMGRLQEGKDMQKLITPEHIGLDGTLDADRRDELLTGMKASVDKRALLESGRSTPEFLITLATGAALSVTLFSLSAIEVRPQNLIYLLIGFILVRFLFTFVQKFLASFQVIMQNFDSLCFVNERIVTGKSAVYPLSDEVADCGSREPQGSQM